MQNTMERATRPLPEVVAIAQDGYESGCDDDGLEDHSPCSSRSHSPTLSVGSSTEYTSQFVTPGGYVDLRMTTASGSPRPLHRRDSSTPTQSRPGSPREHHRTPHIVRTPGLGLHVAAPHHVHPHLNNNNNNNGGGGGGNNNKLSFGISRILGDSDDSSPPPPSASKLSPRDKATAVAEDLSPSSTTSASSHPPTHPSMDTLSRVSHNLALIHGTISLGLCSPLGFPTSSLGPVFPGGLPLLHPGGVIRVPAHRPPPGMPGSGPPVFMPGAGGMPGVDGGAGPFNNSMFPWMQERKDRLTGGSRPQGQMSIVIFCFIMHTVFIYVIQY